MMGFFLEDQIRELDDCVDIYPLGELDWHRFQIEDLFSVSRPAARNKDAYENGDIPFVASGAVNNGVMKLCLPIKDEKLDDGNCLTVSPVDGSVFYQPIDFLGRGGAGSSILMLRAGFLNEDVGEFIARLVQQTTSKYTYGHMGNKDSIKREKIMLPVTNSGEPDYAYMEQYISNLRKKKIEQYIVYVENRIAELGDYVEIPELGGKKWGVFTVGLLFDIYPTKGKTTGQLVDGDDVPYIAAKNNNNGFSGMYDGSQNPEWVSDGNGIVFVQLGDGAAGLAYYIPMNFIGMGGKTSVGYNCHLNKYNGIFIACVLSKNKEKFSHGHSWTGSRLRNTQVMLPVNDAGEPDYAYMEQYSKNMMLRKYQQYLDYLDNSGK